MSPYPSVCPCRYLSWALDTNQEERDKGKTVEVGRAYFETEKKHFTILDAPGHKSFVPNMIGGASQADLAVLVRSSSNASFIRPTAGQILAYNSVAKLCRSASQSRKQCLIGLKIPNLKMRICDHSFE